MLVSNLQFVLILIILNFKRFHGVDVLPCKDIEKSLRIDKEITRGRVKRMFFGYHEEKAVVLSYPSDEDMVEDFSHGLEMLLNFQESGLVTEVIGYCKDIHELKVSCLYILVISIVEPWPNG